MSMLAAVYREFGGPIRVERVPKPSLIRHKNGSEEEKDAVIIQVKATGVCRSDWHGWKGHDSDIRKHGLPFTPGHEVSGVVVETTSSKFKVGDRVAVPFILSCGTCECCSNGRSTVCLDQQQPGFTQLGSFAEYLFIPRATWNLWKIPDNVSYLQAAALGCRFTTAYRAVMQQGRLLNTSKDESIAIFGCGGLGLSCIMLARAQGCRTIIAVDVSDHALTKARELGATHALHARMKNVSGTVQEITLGGAHVVIEASGFATACENAIRSTRRSGRMVQVGLVSGRQKQPANVPMDLITAREIEVVGSHGFAAADLPHLLEMVASKKLDPAVLVENEVTLEVGARAIEEMDQGSPLGITMVTQFQNAAPNVTSRL